MIRSIRRHTWARRGDTLIEVIFALAILASILMVITTGAITAWRTSRLAGERTQAAGLVAQQAEALKAYSFPKTFDSSFNDEINEAVTQGKCMVISGSDAWNIDTAGCNNVGADMGVNKYSAKFESVSSPNCGILASPPIKTCTVKITVSWLPLGSNTPETSSQVVTIREQ